MRFASLSLFGLALSLAACSSFGPQREPPAIALPAHYAASDQAANLPVADGVVQRLDATAQQQPQWWRAYGSDELNALVDEGLRNSHSLAAAQSNLRAAREGLRATTGSSRWPTVDLGFAPSRQRALAFPGLAKQTYLYNIFAAEVQTSYTFDFFGASMLGDRALAGKVNAQAYQFEAIRRALATNIVVATINAASLHEQVLATEEMVTLGGQRARQIAARYQLGSASHDDMLEAEQDAANAAASLPPLRAQALAVRHALAVLLGRPPEQAPAPLSMDALHLPETVPVSVATDLLRQRPDILAAEATLRAAADEAGAATASMFPSLTLSATYGQGGHDWASFTSPSGVIWSMGAKLAQPLFHGGALRAQRRQAAAEYDAAVSLYQQTVLGAFQNVADALVSLEEDANTLAQAQRAATAAQQLQQDADAKYRLGSAFYATLAAGQQYQNARIQYVRARTARLTDTATLFDSMGGPPAQTPLLR